MKTEQNLILSDERCDFILNGNIRKVVWFLSWPIVVQMLLNFLVVAVDMKMVGALGSNAIAAVGMSQQLLTFLYVSARGISVGTTATVARYYGQKNSSGVMCASNQTIIIILVFSAFFSTVGLLSAKSLLTMMGAQGEVLALAHIYLSLLLCGLLFFIGKVFLWSIFQGIGDTKTPLILEVLANTLNISLNYVFIFGLGFIPAYGVAGAGMGTFLAHFITFSIGFYYLLQKVYFPLPSLKKFLRCNYDKLRSILRIGIPVSLQEITQVVANTLIMALVARTTHGTNAVSGYSLGIVIFSFAFFPSNAIATASAAMVGINLGNNNVQRAHESGWKCAGLGALLIFILSVISFVYAPQLVGFFVKDALVVAIGASVVRVVAVVEPIHATGYIIARTMQGAGESKIPFYISTLAWLVIRVPLAWFLAFTLGMQEQGIWLSIASTQVLAALLLILLYHKGVAFRKFVPTEQMLESNV